MASAQANNFMKWCGVAVLVSVAILASLQASAHIKSMQFEMVMAMVGVNRMGLLVHRYRPA